MEKAVRQRVEEGGMLARAVCSGKQILECGMQERSWSQFRDAVDLIQGGSLGRVPQVRTYWWQNYLAFTLHRSVDIDTQALDWKQWLRGAPVQPFILEIFYLAPRVWESGVCAVTGLFTHFIH